MSDAEQMELVSVLRLKETTHPRFVPRSPRVKGKARGEDGFNEENRRQRQPGFCSRNLRLDIIFPLEGWRLSPWIRTG